MTNAEYEAARLAHNAAYAKFDPIRDAYRARKIGDEEFLAAAAEYDAATKIFDAAYAEWEATEEPAAADEPAADDQPDLFR